MVCGRYLLGDREGGGDEGGKHGEMFSSAFVVSQREEDDLKGSFVVNLSRQSNHWEKDTVNM